MPIYYGVGGFGNSDIGRVLHKPSHVSNGSNGSNGSNSSNGSNATGFEEPVWAGLAPRRFRELSEVWPLASESVIQVKDFHSMEALAERIKEIAADQTLYDSYLAWKTRRPLAKSVENILFHGLGNVMCRACVRHRQRITTPEASN